MFRQGLFWQVERRCLTLAAKKEEDVIFVRYFRHYLTGKIVYPKKGEFIKIVLKK